MAICDASFQTQLFRWPKVRQRSGQRSGLLREDASDLRKCSVKRTGFNVLLVRDFCHLNDLAIVVLDQKIQWAIATNFVAQSTSLHLH